MSLEDQSLELLSLREDIAQLGDYLKEIVEALKKESITDYPIFVAHQSEDIEIGRMIIDMEKTKTNWSFNATMIEELIRVGVFSDDQADQFKAVFKDPMLEVCILKVGETENNFIFCPYELDED